MKTNLPLTVIEDYLIRDDSVAYPMDCVRLLHFSGLLLKELISRSFAEILCRHPMLRSRVEKQGSRYFWVPAENPPEIFWKNQDEDPECLNETGFPILTPFNLKKEAGFRLYVVESEKENCTKLLFQFHHSSTDGTGEMQVLAEFMTIYARELGTISPETELPELAPDKLPLRAQLGWTWKNYLRNIFSSGIYRQLLVWKFAQPLFPIKAVSSETPPVNYPFILSLQLTSEETQTYLQKSQAQNVTLNDLLLRDFYVTVQTWRKQNLKGELPPGNVRINVPINLRQPFHKNLPAANIFSSYFIDRSVRQIDSDPQWLLQSIHREMDDVKNRDLKYVFPRVLTFAYYFPGLLEIFLHSGSCRSTGVLSNLKRVFTDVPVPRNSEGKIQLGPCVLESVDAAPPIRSKTMISISALTYADRLRLCFRCDDHFLTVPAIQQFINLFKEQMELS